jgi:suppressor for copper-sensitivity B
MLWFALLGGLILNVMPCVLPVIALKVLGFLEQSRHSPGEVRRHGLIYGAGVLVSFLVLAGMVLLVQAGGEAASWGMQFQNPVFLVVMTTLVTLVALNLFGVFEVTLGGRTMGAAAQLASKGGAADPSSTECWRRRWRHPAPRRSSGWRSDSRLCSRPWWS